MKSARAMRRRSPTSFFVLEQPVDGGVDQGVVADVVELRLHLLPVVRGHQRELLVQPAEDAAGCARPARRPCRRAAARCRAGPIGDARRSWPSRLAAASISSLGLVRGEVGAADQVGRREAAEAAEPGDRQGPLARRRRSRAARCARASRGAGGGPSWRPAAAPGRRRASASPTSSRTTNGWPQVAVAGSSRKSWARPQLARLDRCRSRAATPCPSPPPCRRGSGPAARCLIGRFMSARQCSRTVSDARRHQVAGRRQLLAADDVLVGDAGQVDGRPLPRWTSSTGWSWFCSERTRTRSPRGSHSSSSPTLQRCRT